MTSKVTAQTLTDNAKYAASLTITGDVEQRVGLTETMRDALLYDLIQTLPADNHIRRNLNI